MPGVIILYLSLLPLDIRRVLLKVAFFFAFKIHKSQFKFNLRKYVNHQALNFSLMLERRPKIPFHVLNIPKKGIITGIHEGLYELIPYMINKKSVFFIKKQRIRSLNHIINSLRNLHNIKTTDNIFTLKKYINKNYLVGTVMDRYTFKTYEEIELETLKFKLSTLPQKLSTIFDLPLYYFFVYNKNNNFYIKFLKKKDEWIKYLKSYPLELWYW